MPSAIQFTDDDRLIARLLPNGIISVSSSATGRELSRISVDSAPPVTFASHPGTDSIAVALKSGEVVALDPVKHSQSLISSIQDEPSCLAFSPDGKNLIIGTATGMSWLIRLSSPVVKLQLQGQRDGIRSCAFSNNNSLVATSSQDGSMFLWSGSTGENMAKITAAKSPLTSTAWNTDGTLIATAGLDNLVRVWSVKTTGPDAGRTRPLTIETLATYDRHRSPVIGVHFSATGDKIISVSADGEFHRWIVFSDAYAAIAAASRIAPRCLTKDERSKNSLESNNICDIRR